MAEAPGTPTDAGGTTAPAGPPRLSIQSQYVKDLSFENPNAPQSFESGGGRPEITVRAEISSPSSSAQRSFSAPWSAARSWRSASPTTPGWRCSSVRS